MVMVMLPEMVVVGAAKEVLAKLRQLPSTHPATTPGAGREVRGRGWRRTVSTIKVPFVLRAIRIDGMGCRARVLLGVAVALGREGSCTRRNEAACWKPTVFE